VWTVNELEELLSHANVAIEKEGTPNALTYYNDKLVFTWKTF